MNDLERRFNELRRFNRELETSSHEEFGDITLQKDKVKQDTIELVANQIYDIVTKLFNERRERLGIKGGDKIVEPIRDYNNFTLDDNGNLKLTCKNKVIKLGNINKSLLSPSSIIKELGVKRLKSLGFRNITDEDIRPYRSEYRRNREKVRKLNENLGERSKEIKSSSTTDTEAIEMMEMTSKDIDTTVNEVEQEMSFIEPGERDYCH